MFTLLLCYFVLIDCHYTEENLDSDTTSLNIYVPKAQKKEKSFEKAYTICMKTCRTLNSVKDSLNEFRESMKHMNFRPSYYGDSYSLEPKKKPCERKRALGMEL